MKECCTRCMCYICANTMCSYKLDGCNPDFLLYDGCLISFCPDYIGGNEEDEE